MLLTLFCCVSKPDLQCLNIFPITMHQASPLARHRTLYKRKHIGSHDPAGHTIHQECLRGLLDHSQFVCPMCNKSFIDGNTMQRVWADMDSTVAETPMPEEYRDLKVRFHTP